jgi:hypothetical protein
LGEYSEKQRAQYAIFEEFYSSELELTDIQVMDDKEFKRVNENLRSLFTSKIKRITW